MAQAWYIRAMMVTNNPGPCVLAGTWQDVTKTRLVRIQNNINLQCSVQNAHVITFSNTVTLLILRDKFFRVWQHKNILAVVKFTMSGFSLVTFVLHKENIIQWYIYKQLGSMGLTHFPVYYPFASTHMVNTQLLHVRPKCAYKISQIFLRVFEFALAEFCVKFVKN